MSVRLVTAALAFALPAMAHADVDDTGVVARTIQPLRGGEMEWRAGAGSRTVESTVSVELLLGLRVGIVDRVEVAFPLWLTAVLLRHADGRPLLALGGGIRGIGANRPEGILAQPGGSASLHFGGVAWAASALLYGHGGYYCAQCLSRTEPAMAGYGVAAAVAWRAGSRLVLSIAAGLAWETYPAPSPVPTSAGLGALTLTPGIVAPGIRVLLGEGFELEAWIAYDAPTRPPPGSTVVLAVALGWAGRIWGRHPRAGALEAPAQTR